MMTAYTLRGCGPCRKELQYIGDVTVVAPASEQSAAGHSITLLVPLMVQEVRDEDGQPMGWAVEGKPADCVKLALQELLTEPPDLIVSGLNAGSNAGINVLYSGTVAAAVEGAFYRHTSIACSLEYTKPRRSILGGPHFWPAASSSKSCFIAPVPARSSMSIFPSPERGRGEGRAGRAAEFSPLERAVHPTNRSARPGVLLECARDAGNDPGSRLGRVRVGGGIYHGHAAAIRPHRSSRLGRDAIVVVGSSPRLSHFAKIEAATR